ncbi:Uma2 family endonuclease [Desertifilum sp. FACHB-1129]|uniref:Uma2 family endonuclease n=1 Tax=unclassified Desertifilum TaxID=2621682 RepID=UPI00168583CE|nr:MULTISPECIES: Uma2 family endonuclease [unclassified Desertifilum]MBD2311213.1 Uma2 family endonuclease [Desertifilum sp. FACHB-1129]MBD2324342.1 Uma2 family endonuclease [Desertifilum sp. FACHB-866]MBD2334356.1 Uma2 family endonuclease [Desertifilum sp. FACHB-868]MDA0213203.1 Uma2 family endonuclease [Cyanobacteria bacterium FC1]
MVAVSDWQYLTPQDYLDWEEKQAIKYEYIDGRVFAMTGGTIPHNDLAVNLTTALKNHLRGKGCKVLMTDAKVGVSERGPFHYPDVMVTCDERDKRAIRAIYFPCLIVEVISPSTEAKDRGKKFQNYRRISTLKEYVLVSSEQKFIECFRLNERGVWELYTYSESEEVELKSVNFCCPIDEVYEDVTLEAALEVSD